jgi:aspartate-semialdehyde dehydrogenase
MLGTLGPTGIEPAAFVVSAQCNRVPVFDGHTETVSVKLAERADPERIRGLLEKFRGPPEVSRLPSAPPRPLIVFTEIDRPQPARDVWLEKGMVAMVGRIRPCPVLDVKMVVLGHNTIRGAAGAAVLNGELMLEKGYIRP